MRKLALVMTLASLQMFSSAGQPSVSRRVAPSPTESRYSQEKLDRIRQSLVAQIAVRDDAERAMRTPTPDEAAALAIPSSDAGTIVSLPGGGVALALDGSQLSLVVAVRTDDGTLRITHGVSPNASRVDAAKGGTHAR